MFRYFNVAVDVYQTFISLYVFQNTVFLMLIGKNIILIIALASIFNQFRMISFLVKSLMKLVDHAIVHQE